MITDEDIDELRARLEQQRNAALEGAVRLAPNIDDDPQSAGEFELALSNVDTFTERLAAIPKIEYIREPELYNPSSEFSYFGDLASVRANHSDQFAALERLQRHSEVVNGRRATRRWLQASEARARGVRLEMRALSLLGGDGGEFSPPTFLTDLFASIARSASPVLRAMPSAPLPEGCDEVYIPRVTSSGGVVTEAYENTNAPETWQTTDQIALPIATFAGQVPMSTQLYERGPRLDTYLTKDFAEAFAASAEQQIIMGSGTAGQLLGLLNVSGETVDDVPGANVITYTESSPTAAQIIGAIGQTAAAVGNTRLRPPSVAIMTPERYFWLTATPDGSTNDSMQRPGTGLVPSNADTGEYGPVASLPCLLSGEVPQDVDDNQDVILTIRAGDFLWMPSDPVFEIYIDNVAASQMIVYASWHAYGAFASTRYPSSIGILTGTALNRSALTWY